MDTPDWLSKEFLEKLLKDNYDSLVDNIEIIKYDVYSTVGKGDNYLSNILKIPIKYKVVPPLLKPNKTIQEISLIAKVPITSGEFSAFYKAGIIEKEHRFYTELLPKMKELIKINNDNVDLTPKYFKCDMENILMLEDLQFSGYKMTDRKKQLDYEHGVVVLKSLAKFHAVSVKLHESEPEFVEKIGKDFSLANIEDEEVRKAVDAVLGEAQLERICQEFEKLPEVKKFVPFLQKLKPKVLDVLMDSIRLNDNEFGVLNHGDVWSSNLLFKYDEHNQPHSVKFLDFQILIYSTPAVDLLNFFHTSIRYKVLKTHFQDFIQIYCENLNLNLEKYGSSKRLNLEDLGRSLKKREIFSLIRCLANLPYTFRDCNEFEDDSNISETTKILRNSRMIQNKTYVTVCAKYLEDYSKSTWYQNFK